MNVAIIGAGVAGLSCAHEFERYGITPVVYERNSFVGEQHPHAGAVLEIVHRPIKDAIKYCKEKFYIDIKPLNTVNTIIHYSPNKVTTIKGNFGYFIDRSREPEDLKRQLYSNLKNTKILFNEYADYQKLAREYDYVVVANGSPQFTEELGCWREWVNTYLIGAVVLGQFDPNTLVAWVNKDYCKNGYAYLTPFNSTRATVALVVTDVNEREVENYWDLFLRTENLKYTIVEEFKLNHRSGHVYPHKVGNIYFAGDAAGVIEPFLGFGALGSIITGVMAARSIIEGKDYEKLIEPVIIRNLQMHEFRKAFDLSGNNGYDILMSVIGWPGIKHLLYYTPFNVVKYGSQIMKLIPKAKTKKI